MVRTILKYVWAAFRNLLTIAVVLALYSKLASPFEVGAISILIMIYLGQSIYTSLRFQFDVKNLVAFEYEFKRLRRLLNDIPSDDEERVTTEAVKNNKRDTNMFYFNLLFSWLIELVVLWNLITTMMK